MSEGVNKASPGASGFRRWPLTVEVKAGQGN